MKDLIYTKISLNNNNKAIHLRGFKNIYVFVIFNQDYRVLIKIYLTIYF